MGTITRLSLSTYYYDISYLLRKFKKEYIKWRIEINSNKIGYMVVEGADEDIYLKQKKLKIVDKYKYLELTISRNDTHHIKITM